MLLFQVWWHQHRWMPRRLGDALQSDLTLGDSDTDSVATVVQHWDFAPMVLERDLEPTYTVPESLASVRGPHNASHLESKVAVGGRRVVLIPASPEVTGEAPRIRRCTPSSQEFSRRSRGRSPRESFSPRSSNQRTGRFRRIFRNHQRRPSKRRLLLQWWSGWIRAPSLSNVPGSGWPRLTRIWPGSKTSGRSWLQS